MTRSDAFLSSRKAMVLDGMLACTNRGDTTVGLGWIADNDGAHPRPENLAQAVADLFPSEGPTFTKRPSFVETNLLGWRLRFGHNRVHVSRKDPASAHLCLQVRATLTGLRPKQPHHSQDR